MKSLSPNGYNLTTGGFNKFLSEETKKKISETKKGQISSNKGKKFNDEWKKNMSLCRLGKKRSKSSIEKQSIVGLIK